MTPLQPHPKLAARRRRSSKIRNAVTAIAMAMFIALFSVIYVQMASGNDPALGSSVTNQKVAIAKAAGTSSSSNTSRATTATTSTSTSTSDAASSSSPAPVTTQPAPVTTQQS
jgi:cytoskeletal protein RodZ